MSLDNKQVNNKSLDFIYFQYKQIKKEPLMIFLKTFKVLLYFPACIFFLIVLSLKPIIKIRFGELRSSRIGHFAGNTELYLCEKKFNINTPSGWFKDLFFIEPIVCNQQLLEMWSREITIAPKYASRSLVGVTYLINVFSHFFPSLKSHIIKTSSSDRDVHGLLGKSPIHLKFNQQEKDKGQLALEKMGIPREKKIVLLHVRDSAYLESFGSKNDWSYHNYRDCDIDNFHLVAEKLAREGYFVIRMGVIVKKPLKSNHANIIDYAYNDLRTEFMDIYLSSVCDFVISTGNGGEACAVWNFRKPWVLVNLCPILFLPTFMNNTIMLTKHHIDIKTEKELTLKEILFRTTVNNTTTQSYIKKSIKLLENTPVEVCEASFEMVEKLKNPQKNNHSESILQNKFWEIFSTNLKLNNNYLHGELRATYGSSFLRNNSWWLH
jgi:putative glycosyltransferase (TIGR04372 family)